MEAAARWRSSSFGPALLGLAALLVWAVLRIRRPSSSLRRLDVLAPLGLGGVLHYLAYSLLAVPPYHWYYGPSLTALTVFFVGALAAQMRLPTVPAERAAKILKLLDRAGPVQVHD